jgi:hypothetical protein
METQESATTPASPESTEQKNSPTWEELEAKLLAQKAPMPERIDNLQSVFDAARQVEIAYMLEHKQAVPALVQLTMSDVLDMVPDQNIEVTVKNPVVLVAMVNKFNALLYWGSKGGTRQWVTDVKDARWFDNKEHADYWQKRLWEKFSRVLVNILMAPRKATTDAPANEG